MRSPNAAWSAEVPQVDKQTLIDSAARNAPADVSHRRVSMFGARQRNVAYAMLFAAWFAAVLWLVWSHVFWRDEVRALSFATQGDTVWDMLMDLHGEGHPAIWYLLLRAGHALVGRVALPLTALAIGGAAAAILIWRAPFSLPLKVLLLLTKIFLFEYVVMARNYGISLLLMLIFAWLYPRHRERGCVLGAILFLLANTNIHSTLIAVLLVGFWAVDVITEQGLRWTRATKLLLGNAVLVAAGALICAITVFPTFNDAGVLPLQAGRALIDAVLRPGAAFSGLGFARGPDCLLSIVLYASVAGLLPDIGLALVGAASLVGLSALFSFVHPDYRHAALWLSLMIALYWISGQRARGGAGRLDLPRNLGQAAFAVLLLIQVVMAIATVREVSLRPFSRSRELAALLSSTPELASALVVAEPDYLVEALPYYANNPVYRLREHQFGPIIKYTKQAQSRLDMDEVLDEARRLQADQKSDVVILLAHDLRMRGGIDVHEGYNWMFQATPQQIARFTAATTRLATFGPAVSGESFSVYELRRAQE